MPITKLFRHLKTVCFQSKFILVEEIIQMLFKVSGYKLYRYNPANIYLFKVNHRNTRTTSTTKMLAGNRDNFEEA